jgi:mannose-6-phosphate isomerase-like protein (cupin superfamily)
VGAFERFNGEIFAVVDGDATAAIDERETATRPGLTVRPGLEQRVESVRFEDVGERAEGTGFPSFHGTHRAHDGHTH